MGSTINDLGVGREKIENEFIFSVGMLLKIFFSLEKALWKFSLYFLYVFLEKGLQFFSLDFLLPYPQDH